MAAKAKEKSKRAPSETRAGSRDLMRENMQGQLGMVAEVVMTLNDRLDRSIGEVRRDLSNRIDSLESAVWDNSRELKKQGEEFAKQREELAGVRDELGKHGAELREIRRDLAQMVTRAELERLEARVAMLES